MVEFRVAELRSTGRVVEGRAIAYGDIARTSFGPERFESGAFGDLLKADVILNASHRRDRPLARTGGGGLVLTDGPDALDVRAELPETREADDALENIRRKIYRGLSIEFEPTAERMAAGVRVIERANLSGMGIVDRPAYKGSTVSARAEVRQDGDGLVGVFVYDSDAIISDRAQSIETEERQGPGVRKQRVMPGAFRFAIDDPEREINLLMGRDYDRPLGSKQANTLILNDSPEALRFSVETLPNTSYVSDLRAMLSARAAEFSVAPLFRIPPVSVVPGATSIIPEPGNPGVMIELVNQAVLTGLAIVTRRRWPGSEVSRRSEEKQDEYPRRRRVWL